MVLMVVGSLGNASNCSQGSSPGKVILYTNAYMNPVEASMDVNLSTMRCTSASSPCRERRRAFNLGTTAHTYNKQNSLSVTRAVCCHSNVNKCFRLGRSTSISSMAPTTKSLISFKTLSNSPWSRNTTTRLQKGCLFMHSASMWAVCSLALP